MRSLSRPWLESIAPMRILRVFALVAILANAPVCRAETAPSPSIPAELASPWTTDARPWLLYGVGATALLLLAEDKTDPAQAEIAEDRPIGKFSKIGDYGGQLIPNALYSAAMLVDWFGARDARSLERSEIMLKATLYSISVSEALKYTAHEARPNDRNDRKSFPSGHSTAAFTFASVVAVEHPLPYGIAAFGLATLTGLSRINDNRHYLHDVMAGATIGTAYGLGVAYLHEKARAEPAPAPGAKVQLIPIFDSEAKGAALVAEF